MRIQADQIAIEEPLEIRIVLSQAGKKKDRSISITMRTPGADIKLAVGFQLSEGLISKREDVINVRLCRSGSVVRVFLRDSLAVDMARLQRHFFTSSSCGVCGKASIDAVSVQTPAPLSTGNPQIDGTARHPLCCSRTDEYETAGTSRHQSQNRKKSVDCVQPGERKKRERKSVEIRTAECANSAPCSHRPQPFRD